MCFKKLEEVNKIVFEISREKKNEESMDVANAWR